MPNVVSSEDFRAVARAGGTPAGVIQRLATGPVIEVDGSDRTLQFCFSDESVDRAGDSIKANGWEIDAFLKNSVALWAHDSWSPPIGRAKNVGVVKKRLMGDIEFAPAEAYPFADTVFQLTKGGFINAVSVGFNPLEWTFVNEKDRPYGIDFLRQELLEISVCPVPCNSNALVEARSKGIDTRPLKEWAEKVLDEGGSILVPKDELDALRKGASEAAPVRYYLTGGKSLSGSQIAVVKGQFDEWIGGDGKTSFVLPDDMDIKAVGEGAPVSVVKAGRKLSKKNSEYLAKAMEHIQCVMDSNDPDEAEPVEEPAAEVVETVVDPKAALREAAKVTLAAARAA